MKVVVCANYTILSGQLNTTKVCVGCSRQVRSMHINYNKFNRFKQNHSYIFV